MHYVRVTHRVSDGPSPRFIDFAKCECGWIGPDRDLPNAARLDKYRHQVAVGDRKPPQRKRSSRPRDGRKNKVYAAERAAFLGYLDKNEYANIAEVREVFESWTRTAWFKSRYLGSPISLTSGGGSSHASYGAIKLNGRWHLNRWVLAHELAHVLTLHYGEAAHGRKFCGTYIALVTRFIGKEEGDKLRAAFVAAKIPHKHAVPIRRKRKVTTKAAA